MDKLEPIRQTITWNYTTVAVATTKQITIGFSGRVNLHIQLDYSGLTVADATVKLQRKSINSAKWVTIPGSTTTLTTADDSTDWTIIGNVADEIRISYTPGTSAACNLATIYVTAKQ